MSITNPKFRKIVEKQDEQINKQKISKALSASEKMAIVLETWHDHVIKRNEIASYTTIVGDKMLNIFPQENHVLLPFEEFHGDHAMNWILTWDLKEKRELFRKNTKQVDLIEWMKPIEK